MSSCGCTRIVKEYLWKNWNRSICEILRKYEPRQNTTASQINLQEFGQCLQEAFITKWTDDLWNDIRVSEGNNKLRTYRTFKTVFAWEHYLSAVTNRSHLIARARFRTSCHGLQIEVGRYHKPPISPELRAHALLHSMQERRS